MDALTNKFDQLQERLENAAFLASQGSAKEAHSEIFRCTTVLSEIRRLCVPTTTNENSISTSSEETIMANQQGDEVKKVRNRLRLWVRRQQQYNSRILNAFLRLEKLGPVTESALRRECSELNFDSNFAQMKIVAERNHGKIFHQQADVISIWPPIAAYVREYERAISE